MISISIAKVFLLVLVFIALTNVGFVNSSSVSESTGEVSKTKCREHIEEALKSYWDGEKKGEPRPTTERPTESSEELSQEDVIVKDSHPDGSNENQSDGTTAESTEEDSQQSQEADPSTGSDANESKTDDKSCDEDGSCQQNDESQQETEEVLEDEETEEEEEAEREVDESSSEEAPVSDEDTGENETEEVASEEESSEEAETEERNETNEESNIEENRTAADEGVESSASDNTDENETAENQTANEASDETAELNEQSVTEKTPETAEEEEVEEENDSGLSESDESDASDNLVETPSENVPATEETTAQVSSEESDEEEEIKGPPLKSRAYIEDTLKLYEIGSKEDLAEQSLIQSLFRDLKKIYESAVKPMEQLYKYRAITNRLISDSEIFSKPLVVFLGAKGSGKTSLVNYILGLQSTPWQLKTGLSMGSYFTLITYGQSFSKLSPTELAADHTFSSLQQFGEYFMEHHIQAYKMPIDILQKMTIVDSPGLLDGTWTGKTEPGKQIDSEVYQWFIDRSDLLYIVIDFSQLHMTNQLQSLIDQLKGREIRFIVNKADQVSHSQLIHLIGQLLWMLSPVMTSDEPPQVYALTSVPTNEFDFFLDDQEQSWINDLAEQISGMERVESRVSTVRRHAVRVRNHAKLIDCYLSTYYRNKGFFTFGNAARLFAADITENPGAYRVLSVTGQNQNMSKYDLPDPSVYKEFFRANPLIDFKSLSSTCSFFKGCPLDKLDTAIAYQLPDLIGKYKKLTKSTKK